MGQTDKQFGGFLRMLIARLKRALEADSLEDCKKALTEILTDLQNTLED